jgi:hypothetical protein
MRNKQGSGGVPYLISVILHVVMAFLCVLVVSLGIAMIVGCSRVHQSYNSERYEKHCQEECQKKYGTDLDWVGFITGDCYCK